MVPNLKYTNVLPVHVGVNELPVGILGIIEQFAVTMELDISNLLGNLLHAQPGWSQLFWLWTHHCTIAQSQYCFLGKSIACTGKSIVCTGILLQVSRYET